MLARALPWLLVLPALLFATPLSPLTDDPFPHLAGAGLAALALVPLALLVLVRGASGGGAWPFALAFLWALVSWRTAGISDTLEARRALLLLAPMPLVFAGGAALDARGRATFEALLVALSCAWTGYALVLGVRGGGWAGVLGDSGSLSQAALPGAAIASAWIARDAGAKRWLGVLVLALFLVHVAAAPVITGSHTLLAGLLLASWKGPERGRGARLVLALVALLAPFAGMAARQALEGHAPTMEGAPEAPSHSLTGLGVRAMVWSAALPMIAAHPLLGVGPGQFQTAFPPHRDPREIELSRHGVCSELDTEVEHAHNDWLQGFCELGLVGGALFACGLVWAMRAALRALRDEQRLPAALAALALLVNAFVHAPLSSNPAASALALALFGSLTVGSLTSGSLAAPGPSRRAGRVFAGAALAVVPFAPALIKHGAALTEYIHCAQRVDALSQSRDGERGVIAAQLVAEAARARAVVTIALGAAPDSAPARELAARNLAEGEDPLAAWERLLAVRPNAVEAWERTADLCATRGALAEARRRYARALALSPTHPRLLRDLARLECTQGELADGLATIERLRATGCLAPDWTASLGVELVLELGRPERGARLLFEADLEGLVPEDLHAKAKAAEGAPAAAAECVAQLLWARAHVAEGAFEVALRNYRQAAEKSHAARGAGRGPAPAYSLELAAAETRAERREDALARARAVALEPATWSVLPAWARDALLDLGLTPPE